MCGDRVRVFCYNHKVAWDKELPQNPFTPDFGIRPNRMVGTDALLDEISSSLVAGPRNIGFTRVLIGQRGSGKTSLLSEIGEQASQHGFLVISVDAATSGLPQRIIAKTSSAVRKLADTGFRGKNRLSNLGVGPLSFGWDRTDTGDPATDLHSHLDLLADRTAEKGFSVLLTVDELHAGDREELRRLSADLQDIIKINQKPLALLSAGLPQIKYTILRDKKMTFFHRCMKNDTPITSYSDAWKCLRFTVENAGGSIDDDALAELAQACDNSTPYRLQSIGYHAWELADAPSRSITMQSVSAAIRLSDAEVDEKILTPMWYDMGEIEQEYLAVVARLGGKAHLQDVKQRMPHVSRKNFNLARDRLEDEGHLRVCENTKTVQMIGALTLEYVTKQQEIDFFNEQERETPVVVAQGMICNDYMPVAQARCVLPQGHSGRHRSRK